MKKTSIIMAVLAYAIIAAAYTNSVPISANTRAATEKWTAIRFEPALPPTPENAASKFLNGNREWQTVASAQPQSVVSVNGQTGAVSITAASLGAITAEQDPIANAALTVHINRADNPHGVTAAQIGALTAEQDLAALRTYHYGSPDIVESPAEWFVFDGAGTITAFNWSAGRTNVVIPWEIGGVPVTTIAENAFAMSDDIISVIAPQTVTTIGDSAFSDCTSLASVSLPQATAIGSAAFNYCIELASVSLPQATAIGEYAFTYCSSLTSVYMGQNAPGQATNVFANITPPPTVYVTDPQATGWGAVWNGAPVVRPPLYGSHVTAQAYTLNGDTITEWPSSGGSVPYTDWTGTVTPADGTATVSYAHGSMPVLVVPDGGGTTYVTVATGTYAATSGVSRVSLSIWAGTNTIELVTNEVDYVSAPDIPTNGWGTILFRRVSDGRWKGVGL